MMTLERDGCCTKWLGCWVRCQPSSPSCPLVMRAWAEKKAGDRAGMEPLAGNR